MLLIISPDKSRGYTGLTSVTSPLPYVLTCVRDNVKPLSRILFKCDTHVFGPGQEPYFKETVNFQ